MRGNFEEAIKHYNNSLNLNPEKPDCLYNLGNAYCIKLDFENALKCFQKSIDLDPNNSVAIYNLANTYYV